MSKQVKKKRKMLWALDPYSQTDDALLNMSEAIKQFTSGADWEIEPVYVLSPVGLNWLGEFSRPWPKEYSSLAEQKIEQTLKRASLKNLGPAKILRNKSSSVRKDAGLLLSYAKKNKASCIALSTHSRAGLSRLLLGSFTIEMLLSSKIPLLVMNPHVKRIAPIKEILCPIDLSHSSRLTLGQVAEMAKAKNAKIILLNKVVDVINPYVQSGVVMTGGGWVSVDQFLKTQDQQSERQLTHLADRLRSLNVEVEAHIQRGPLSIAEEVLDFAEKTKPQLICMSSQIGPISSFILGSVAREVMLKANVPVWIVHH